MKAKITQVADGPYKLLYLSARSAAIQRVPLVERVTLNRITPALPPVEAADFATKNLDG